MDADAVLVGAGPVGERGGADRAGSQDDVRLGVRPEGAVELARTERARIGVAVDPEQGRELEDQSPRPPARSLVDVVGAVAGAPGVVAVGVASVLAPEQIALNNAKAQEAAAIKQNAQQRDTNTQNPNVLGDRIDKINTGNAGDPGIEGLLAAKAKLERAWAQATKNGEKAKDN